MQFCPTCGSPHLHFYSGKNEDAHEVYEVYMLNHLVRFHGLRILQCEDCGECSFKEEELSSADYAREAIEIAMQFDHFPEMEKYTDWYYVPSCHAPRDTELMIFRAGFDPEEALAKASACGRGIWKLDNGKYLSMRAAAFWSTKALE